MRGAAGDPRRRARAGRRRAGGARAPGLGPLHLGRRAAAKGVRGELDLPVEVGGIRIQPGDVIVLDADGAVVVPRARRYEVLAAAEARAAKERDVVRRLEAGQLTLDLMGLRDE